MASTQDKQSRLAGCAGGSDRADPPGNLFRNGSFILLWCAYGGSAFGDHLSELGLMRALEIEQSTHQVQTQALMMFMFFVPFFAFGWLAGTVADRLPRRAVMITADLARAAILLALPAWLAAHITTTGADLDQRDLYVALMPLMGLGLFATFFSPARQALLPVLVRDDQLVRANSAISGLGTIGAMLSNLVGGVLAAISPMLNFMTNAATFVISAIFVAGIRVPKGRMVHRPAEPFVATVLDGVRYVGTHRRVQELILLASLFWAGAGIFTSTLPSVVFSRYGLDHEQGYVWVGYMRGTLAGGMLLGAIALTALGERVRAELVNLVALVGAGLSLIAFAWAERRGVGVAMGILVGFNGAMLLISVNTMLQRIVPNRWRGRVFGITDMATIAGLLAATGLLGLWPIPGLDRLVPEILTALGVAMIATGIGMHMTLSRRANLRGWQLLLWRVNEFYARWWYRVQRDGPCTVPAEGPAIIAANHTSYVDPMLLYATCRLRLISFLVAREYYNLPGIHAMLAGLKCIPTARTGQDLAATREAIRHLQEGLLLGVFPQGRIERPGETIGAIGGIAMLAMRTRAPVIPVHISGTRFSESLLWTLIRRHRARVRYGQPIDLSAYYDRPLDREVRREIGDLILGRIRELGGHG